MFLTSCFMDPRRCNQRRGEELELFGSEEEPEAAEQARPPDRTTFAAGIGEAPGTESR